MSVPEAFQGRMRLPVIAAPMFLVSGPELVLAACRSGVAGTFPALNARTPEILDEWLGGIDGGLAAQREAAPDAPCAPYGVNLILHASNPRVKPDLELLVKHRTPFVITSLGHPGEVVEAVKSYGGLVFSDVIHAYHAKKAIAAGVDGVIAVAGGAGGHAGTQSPFSLVREIREFWNGTLILAGSMSDGASVRAAEIMGADFAYMGTRFIATRESMAQPEYKQMVVDSAAGDIVYTDAISGTNANFMWPSLEKAGFDRTQLSISVGKGKIHGIADEAKAWRDVWSAGHGVATIHDIPSVAELVARMGAEYDAACATPPSKACVRRP
ncbi:NAD(P)H-dependent flavin oxidoreductase [Cognatazoarcus halotolerans]|uniref:NAD(P)H-dependent flavin oxidoreductase n=1 Tax=Cognatazoarcus halotolerans TaxID=2686016 RepID=UPI00135CE24B|nr:nitronate monooxygenase [Cognatazoarcus halotolerans]MCB1897852.1 nitronate monooxygenase [Rhodocyclaceae bacterium]MCP5311748.1 nitronate monooxygenase [Zoogloeaceae bacterium]